MNSLQHCKWVAAIKPAAILDNASATATEIDATGYDFVAIAVTLGATDIAVTALKVQAASSSGGSFSDVTGANFDGGTGLGGATLALPSATDDGQVCLFLLDVRNKNPFLKVVATFGDGSVGGYISAVACLGRGKNPPVTSSGMADGDVCIVV